MATYLTNKNKVYVIEYNAPHDNFKDYLLAINEMVDSFAFVTPNRPAQDISYAPSNPVICSHPSQRARFFDRQQDSSGSK